MENQTSRRTIKFWTKEEIALFTEGKTDQEIAKLTGRTPGAISVKRSELKRKNKTKKATRKYGPRKTSTMVPSTTRTVTSSNDLHFVVNGLDLYVNNGCKNVYIRKDKVEVNF